MGKFFLEFEIYNSVEVVEYLVIKYVRIFFWV